MSIKISFLTLLACMSCVSAFASGDRAGAAPSAYSALSAVPTQLFSVYPAVGYVGQARTLFLTTTRGVCDARYEYTLDTTSLATRSLIVLRSTRIEVPCPQPTSLTVSERTDFTFTLTRTGPVSVSWDLGGPDLVIQTLAARIPSRHDVNGMWFDAASNGSGISIHHRRTTSDNAFGTWFMFGNDGNARWYSLQSANWQQDGSVLEGLLIGAEGTCARADLLACPATGSVPRGSGNTYAVAPAVVRITFQSATRAKADVLTLGGNLLFSSELTRLAF